MENQELYDKYLHTRHWDSRPAVTASVFAIFLLQHKFNEMVVDLGCGSGRDVEKMASFGLNVLGVDKCEQEVRAASLRYPNLHFLAYNIEDRLFAANSVGAFHAVNVFHYVNQPRAIAEIRRTLRPGGWLFIHFNLVITDLEQDHVDYQQSEEEILALVQGFQVEQQVTFTREDQQPFLHRHSILQLILRKK